MLELRFVDRSVALGGKAFISFLPLVIVVAAFLPAGTRASVLSVVTHRLGITGQALTLTRRAFASADDTRRATGVLGLVFAIFYASSFTAALQRAYLDTWRRPKDTMVGSYTRGLLWCLGIIAYSALQGAIRWMFSGVGGVTAFVIISLFTTVGVWWLTSWLMLAGKVRARVLLPTGIVTGLAMAIYASAALIWMPDTLTKNQNQFGFFGVALALVTWFSGAATCVIVGACVGAVAAEDPGPLGRFIRGRE